MCYDYFFVKPNRIQLENYLSITCTFIEVEAKLDSLSNLHTQGVDTKSSDPELPVVPQGNKYHFHWICKCVWLKSKFFIPRYRGLH